MRTIVVSRLYADAATRGKLRALAGLGCTIGAVVPASWRRARGERAQAAAFGDDAGVRVFPVPVRGDSDLVWDRSNLRRALAEFRPDVVQVEEEPASRVAAAVVRAASRLRYRVVVFSSEILPPSLPLLTRLRRDRVLRRAAGLIGGSRQALARLNGGRTDVPTTVLPQIGVTPPLATESTARAALAIGFVGRLVPERGLDLLLRACVRLGGRWTLNVAGTGPAQEELEGLAEKLGMAAHVTWHGGLARADLAELWPRLHCAVFPARTTPRWVETRGRATLEAMAHGLAVVVSDSGALPDLVGPAGVMVPEEGVDQLAATLQGFIDDPETRRALGAAARRRVLTEYTDEPIAERTLAFWRTVSGSASP